MKKNTTTIENAWICQVIGEDIFPLFGDIIITNGKISKIRAKSYKTYQKNPDKVGKDSLNVFGRVVTIPFANFHDHIYSRLAKGLPLKGDFGNFQNILHNLWWKIDRALDKDMITASAQMAAIDSIRNGVTYIFDHHSSQDQVENSLSTIRKVLMDFNLRGVLCFESTDRNGSDKAAAGLNENKNFFTSQLDEEFRCMLGLHASFTLSEDTLEEAYKLLKEYDLGIHMHVAEDESDIKLSLEYAGASPINRLKKYKLMNEKGILVHGVHLKEKDFIKISEANIALAFCLDSNMNNKVGLPQFIKIPNTIPFLLGTDGMHSNIAKSFKQIFLTARNQSMSFEQSMALIKRIYFDQLEFIKKYFSDFPSIKENDRADLIVWDYVPPTPLNNENFWGHFIYGMLESPIHTVLQNGNYLMKEFCLFGVDENGIRNSIFNQGERLYNKLNNKTKN